MKNPTARSVPKVLFMDDSQERWKAFQNNNPDTKTWVKTAKDAIARLPGDYTMIFLDHDLGSGAGNGMDVVNWLIDHREYRDQFVVIVHSWNPVGFKMVQMLEAAGYLAVWAPFNPGAWVK